MIDRRKFFEGVRPLFRPMVQTQVDGINFLLDQWGKNYRKRTSIPQFAVVLATSYHETAHTMQPIHEHGNRAYFMRMYDMTGARPHVARALGNTEVGDGVKYAGRGFVQLTGRSNYRRATQKLKALGLIGPDVDFERDPNLVMMGQYAAPILFVGMEEGWFTGRKLDAIVDDVVDGDEHADFIRSRAIINGTDRDKLIAGYAMTFLNALVASVTDTIDIAPPVVPDVPQPVDAPGASLWNRFWLAVAEIGKKT